MKHKSVGAYCIRSLCHLIVALTLLLPTTSHANIEMHDFKTPQQEQLYTQLINELRCLVCQNQNLADSNAALALDLRQKTYEMVSSGASRDEIVDFMVSRYGEFVLYRPPVQQNTLLLWLGPGLFLLVGIGVAARIVLRNSKRDAT